MQKQLMIDIIMVDGSNEDGKHNMKHKRASLDRDFGRKKRIIEDQKVENNNKVDKDSRYHQRD